MKKDMNKCASCSKKMMKKSVKKAIQKDSKMSGDKSKFKKVMHEFKSGELHSGSKKGPVVTNPKQALAISFSEAAKLKKRK